MYFFDYGNAFLLEASRAGKVKITNGARQEIEGARKCFFQVLKDVVGHKRKKAVFENLKVFKSIIITTT